MTLSIMPQPHGCGTRVRRRCEGEKISTLQAGWSTRWPPAASRSWTTRVLVVLALSDSEALAPTPLVSAGASWHSAISPEKKHFLRRPAPLSNARMAVLEKGCSLPDLGSAGFTLSTYNVLLPNSNDGWWIYKYYQKHVPMDQRAWSHRCKLTKSNILGSGGGADIVCVQETSADSFDADFEFMKDAGYDHVLHTKFRFRTATFFRRTKFELKGEKHGDRVSMCLRVCGVCESVSGHIVV
jgi:hypothetical protein